VQFAPAIAYSEPTLRERVSACAGDLVGPATSVAQIDKARQAIVDLYRGDGYLYTAVSARISGTTLTITAIEGYIKEVKLDGDQGAFATLALKFLGHLVSDDGHPLKTTDLEHWLLLTSDIPGVSLSSVLRSPAADEPPGALTLVVRLHRDAISGLVTLDNRAYWFTGPNEGLGVVDFNSFTSLGERTELSLLSSLHVGQQLFGQASTEVFLGDRGLKLKIYGGAGYNEPGGPLKSEDYFGFTTIFGAQLSYPVIRLRQQTLNVTANFDALQSSIDTSAGSGAPSTRLSYDSMRVLRAGVDYAWYDMWAGGDRGATNAVAIKLSQGLHALGASPNGETDAPRTGERTDLFKIKFDLSRTQRLFGLWTDASLSLRGALSGQYSPDILPPAEEFFLGGPHFDRGYYAGEVTGDSALVGTVELLLDTTIITPAAPNVTSTAQFYTFFDAGQAWNNQPNQQNITLRSAGLGVRFYPNGTPKYEMDVEGVQRFTLFPNGSGPGVSALNGQAVYWMLLVRF